MLKNSVGENIKILIVVPRYNLTNEPDYCYAMPLGLGYISAVLKKERYEVDCLNLNHYHGTIKSLMEEKLDKKKYDFVCTGNNALGYAVTEKIIDSVKSHKSHPKFILGGIIITTEPETVFKLLKPDFAVIGEGEETIIELLDYIKKNQDLTKVKGIGFRDEKGKVVFTEKREPIKDLDSLPYPDIEGFEFEKQIENLPGHWHYLWEETPDHPRPCSIIGSRGCPFNCTFCYHENRYRARTIEGVINEIKDRVNKFKINTLVLYDDCFSVDRKRVYEFCDKIKKIREEISWDLKWTCQLTVQNVDSEMLMKLKESGCDTISYGFESFSPVVLKSMRKPITPEMISNAFNKTIKAKMGIQANFIFGDIAETKETAYETLNWWKKHCQGQVNLGFIQPYPGSEIYRHCLKKGIIDKTDFIKNQISTEHWYNMTDKMSDEEISQLRRDLLDARVKYYTCVRPISIRITGNSCSLKVKCPFCGDINLYNNCEIKSRYLYYYLFVCKQCHMNFKVVSFIRKIAFKYHSQLKVIRDLQLKASEFLKKRKM